MNKTDQLRKMLRRGLVDSEAMHRGDIPFSLVYALMKRGEAKRAARGLYSSADAAYSDMADYEMIAMKVPQGVFCLLSALRIYDLTDENPHKLYVAIRHGYHPPRVAYPPIRFVYRSEPLFSAEIVTRRSNGVAIRVYSLEQTLADCFMFRNAIGQDVALAALKEAFSKNRVDRNKLWEAARRCRVTRIMRPYLEAFS